MESNHWCADREVRRLLSLDEPGLAEAFVRIDAQLRTWFARGARDRLPGLQPEDLADAWQESMKDLLIAVRARRIDLERELAPWLWKIFLRRAVDSVRRGGRYQIVLERARAQLRRGLLGGFLTLMDGEEQKGLLLRARQAVSTLPFRQRTVIQVFVDHFPATEDLEELRRRVSEATGQEESRFAVKRALQEARRKIADALSPRPLQAGRKTG